MNYFEPLISDNTYHIFSRAIGSEKLFTCTDNHQFFLRKIEKYVLPIADIHSYALLPNHFHILIQVKSYHELLALQNKRKSSFQENNDWQPKFVIQQFSNLLNSYTKSFNKKYNRKGALFMDYIRRVEVKKDSQYSATLFYIHKNPIHHGYCDQIEDWKWTSYKSVISNSPTLIQRNKIIDWFDTVERFEQFHKQPINLKNAVVIE